ncbi:4-hydroxy-tetrahydrodipicolinate synthase [Bosea thiooxidans]|uniref:4-hydroxy-tetrahydrodipicolinate synthase n=1 Tax=Bosea thiooxidans TaxID=53254 RepID=A0A0Q3I7J0_9HYPH|nr:4-hydroxy-tetrahydrodipicolinate synthase [Bosea thiooxidans]KQK31000.1 4-hydroxy-tetrahydrodipicolinate synthase [Bosea thiooxidans]SKB94385.1 4-hydroxy-tetrahydrodipicolinate synthase [Bosea thiooxidans]
MIDPELRRRLCGVFTALVTPFRDGTVDVPALEKLIAAQLAAGVAGLVPVGTTGEAATLSDEEAEEVIRVTVKAASGRAFVMAGAGSNATRLAIAKAKRAQALGADGILLVTPYYNKPSQDGLFDHFSAIAEAVDLPIMLYSVPGRTGVEIAPATAARLAQAHPHIVGIKEAGGKAERITELRQALGADFVIHSGDDGLTLPFLAVGADGVTSVASNLLPAEVAALCRAWAEGRPAEARRIHEALFDLVGHLFIESNPVPVKTALARTGLIGPELRAPLAPLRPENRKALEASLQSFEARANI